ncbi:MAG: response regulator transcription factor [Nitrospinales bacterium]
MPKPLIHIVGPSNSQNTGLASLLQTETEANCLHTPELNPSHATATPRCLVLWDSQGGRLGSLWSWLETGRAKRLAPPLIVLFNLSPGTAIDKNLVRQGVRGVFFSNESPEMILKGIRGVLDGKLWLSRDIMTTLLLQPHPVKAKMEGLTDREKEVLGHIASGSSNKQIADELCIGLHTVKSHIYSVFKKINVTRRLEAALWASRHL